jgi:hypothetical protein
MGREMDHKGTFVRQKNVRAGSPCRTPDRSPHLRQGQMIFQ